MGKSQETFSKKEKEKKKLKKRQDKAQKKEDRKANSDKGKSFEDMFAYVDEYGNISNTPPDPTKRREYNLEEISIGVGRRTDDEATDNFRRGVISFFNSAKAFGFIRDSRNGESIFVHQNSALEPIKEGDKVMFTTEKSIKGISAINVKIDK